MSAAVLSIARTCATLYALGALATFVFLMGTGIYGFCLPVLAHRPAFVRFVERKLAGDARAIRAEVRAADWGIAGMLLRHSFRLALIVALPAVIWPFQAPQIVRAAVTSMKSRGTP